MKTIFMGTPTFAVPVLAALLEADYDVVAVYTQPDRPAGRGKRPAATPVKRHALAGGLPVFQPSSLRQERAQEEMESLSPDVVIVAAYGILLPGATLELPPLGCLNVHPSLLPRYRGASPVPSSILSGDAVTGVTIIKLDEGTDTGAIIARRETPVAPRENAEDLTMRLFQMGASLLVEVLPAWAQGQIQAQPQDHSRAVATNRLSKKDGEIDWELGAAVIARQVLAYYPWPGSFTRWKGRLLKVIEADVAAPQAATPLSPGRVVTLENGAPGVETGDEVLALKRLQLEGRRAVEAREFAGGHPDFPGSTLG